MGKIIKPSLGVWTRDKIAKYAATKLWEWSHQMRAPHYMYMGGKLWLKHIHDGVIHDHGLVGVNQVTNVFVNDVVDNLIAEVAAFGDYKYHQSGVGVGAEAATDTVATIDLTGPPPTPATGTQVENAANIYESVATVNYVSTLAITEHGIGNNATWASGILMDRTKLPATINVVNGDSIEFTYRLTLTAGS